jgi:hypothetical protein
MSHLPTQLPSSSNPSPAVEVVATFGDSVVGVRHVSETSGGKVTSATRTMIIGGAVSIAAGTIAFLAATRIASANHAGLTAWVEANRPAYAFRPELVPMWMSLVSFLGFALGFTALVTGLSRRRRELEPSTISIGTGAGVDFAVGGTAAPHQQLVAPAVAGDGFALDLTGMTGEITDGAGTRPIASAYGATALPVTQGMRVRAQLGSVSFHIAAVEAPRRQATPLFAGIERRTLSFVAASAAVHLALWGFARTVAPDANAAQVDMSGYELVSINTNGTSQEDPPPPEQDPTDETGESGEDGMIAMALEQGTIGSDKDNSRDPAKRQIKIADRNELARQEALAAARSAGVLGSTALRDGDMFASLVGTGDVSGGFDDLDIVGAIEGDGTGAPRGFGQNASGNGFGGGGTSYRVGGYNTIRDGSRVGEGWGIPGAHGCKATSGVCKPHIPKPPVVIGRPERIDGDYDGAIIKRYVKRKYAQISYCYEKQLIAKPDLEGTVMATWVISMQGTVQNASATGVDAAVSSCIANVIGSINFPKPPQVGVYQVRYPFVLHKTAR